MASFPYASQIYNSIPNVFRDMNPMYAEAPRLRYEKQKAEEQQAYSREMDAKKMQMAEQEFAAQQTSRHLDNAVKLLKLGGAGAASGYLDKFTPGHGLSIEGMENGAYRVKSSRGGSGGGGAAGALSIASNGWMTQLDKNGRPVMTNGVITMVNPKGERVNLKAGSPEADAWFAQNNVPNPIIGFGATGKKGSKRYETRRVYNKMTGQVEALDFDVETGQPATFDPDADLGGSTGGMDTTATTSASPASRPSPVGTGRPITMGREVLGPGLMAPAPAVPEMIAAPPVVAPAPSAPDRLFPAGVPGTVLDAPMRKMWETVSGPNLPPEPMRAEPRGYWPDPRTSDPRFGR